MDARLAKLAGIVAKLDRRRIAKIAKIAGIAASLPLLVFVHLLTGLGIKFWQWPASDWFRSFLAVVYGLACIVAFVRFRPYWRTALLSLVPPFLVWLSYGLIEPKQNGDYPPETSRASRVDFDGDRFTLHDVRNFDYRTETDFDARWEDRTYDLSQLRTVDYIVCWWTAGQQIAHTMLSFGFADGRYLTASIEIRRENSEVYGPIDGLYRRYELIYIFGDERDLIRLRTNYRGEEVRLYRTKCTPGDGRLVLEDYLRTANRLAAEPAFYNTFSSNCTSCIAAHINNVLPRKIPWYTRRLRNGFTDRRSYEAGWIVGEGDFAVIRERARINDRAKAADQDPDFSTRIRTHLGS